LRVGLERLKRLAQTGIGIGAVSNDSNEDPINNDNDHNITLDSPAMQHATTNKMTP
jgi:hypothetical protein